ncbi:hypothetical protein VB10N_46620 [Vibrio sp. 10N]|nr:hypothetical protein VB10N_46620 [Vibrio sp. 10N]
MNNVAYASNAVTLDDYFHSNICNGKSIYCAFELESGSIEAKYIAQQMTRCGVEKIEFQNGLVLYPDCSVSTRSRAELYVVFERNGGVF